jgi:hypothetical protein
VVAEPGQSGAGGQRAFYQQLAERLIAHAEHTFALSKKEPDGATRRQHLEQVAAATGITPPDLVGPDLPLELAYLLQWWAELSAARGQGFSGPLPLSFTEIDAWSRLTGSALTAFEVSVLRDLDRAFLQSVDHDQPRRH